MEKSKLRFYNTKSRKIEYFVSQKPNFVSLYTCGPTVYGSLHIGNWLAYIRWDTLVRTLISNGYNVKRVINITDVGHLVSDADEGEDKLQIGAQRENITAFEVAKRYENEFYQGMHELCLLEPTWYARATDFIDQQIALIKILEQKGAVYQISDGLYFDTSKFPSYAEFAKLDLSNQEAGARVESNPEKHQPWDFALWKFSPIDKKRDMEWDSPWGRGFPGWHLECSAIAIELLGQTLDIHTGGIDHIPVHHTNEIAQSETATNKTFANFWLHNNFLLIEDTKISKSLENGITLNDLSERGFTPLDFKMMALQSHYRTEANFSWEVLESARSRLKELKSFVVLRYQPNPDASLLEKNYFIEKQSTILDCLNDDLSTPKALATVSETINWVFKNGQGIHSSNGLDEFNKFIAFLDSIFGLDLMSLPDITSEQKDILRQRALMRSEQNWAESDSLRQQLLEQGIEVKDTNHNQIWNWA